MAASVAAHALVVVFLIVGLPWPKEAEDDQQALDVTLVPPPEPIKPPQAEVKEEKREAEETSHSGPAAPVKTLQPLVQFGDKESGPRISREGAASSEEAELSTPSTPSAPEGKVAAMLTSEPPRPMIRAKKLYSTDATMTTTAMTAMGKMPRSARGGELCVTEMREQLRHASPAFWPDLLPAYRLGEGTVMETRDAAFRADGQWYDLAFRCEVDPDVTRVVSFSFATGGAIPREEWKRRGFPSS